MMTTIFAYTIPKSFPSHPLPNSYTFRTPTVLVIPATMFSCNPPHIIQLLNNSYDATFKHQISIFRNANLPNYRKIGAGNRKHYHAHWLAVATP
jgi:hypothetical protein